MSVLTVTPGRTDPPVAIMEPNVVSLSLVLANMRLETFVPVSTVPVVDVSRVPPEKSRSTVVRQFEGPVSFPESPAVRSLPFLITRYRKVTMTRRLQTMRDTALYFFLFELYIMAWIEERESIQERGERGVRTSIPAVKPPMKMTSGMRYTVCATLTMLTKTLVEKTERTMILWFEGNFTRHSKRSGRATRMTTDNASAK